ncbi:nuclear transport factor 2 family protein [Streptacidiphilus rugosus]|uniref:nuclear transport factor 2 family protein n=1 Tax=Streptacidiphilus rugosus TaxID=405783 RepID=UPI00055E33BF|nr:nuclear transport factor 2 family protein [Streptacidiphilus rugosus]
MIIYPAAIAARLRTALHEGDSGTLAALFHPDVHFQPLDPFEPAGTGSDAALAWYRDRRELGYRTEVEELFSFPAGVVLGLRITRPAADSGSSALLYRLFRLKDDRVVQIRDFTDRTRALNLAEAPFPSAG